MLALIVGGDDGNFNMAAGTPEARAVSFLSVEVARWSRENRCFSCHNNGDAARALYAAAREGYRVPDEALAQTTRWLTRPLDWDHNGGEGPFSDKRLGRVVFTSTLETAVATHRVRDRSVLVHAADRLALDQAANGCWALDGEDATGSPATYGRAVATLTARNCLSSADARRFRVAIDHADAWLSAQEIRTLTDASVCLLAAASPHSPRANPRRTRSLDLLRQGQGDDGGWGPLVNSPPEPFDTSLAILALSSGDRTPAVRAMIARGRAFLVAEQQKDGSWIETTRPAGNISYAQRISTSGWATLALLASRDVSMRAAAEPER